MGIKKKLNDALTALVTRCSDAGYVVYCDECQAHDIKPMEKEEYLAKYRDVLAAVRA